MMIFGPHIIIYLLAYYISLNYYFVACNGVLRLLILPGKTYTKFIFNFNFNRDQETVIVYSGFHSTWVSTERYNFTRKTVQNS